MTSNRFTQFKGSLSQRGFGSDHQIESATRSSHGSFDYHSTRNEALPGVMNQFGNRTDDIIDMIDVMELRNDIFKTRREPRS